MYAVTNTGLGDKVSAENIAEVRRGLLLHDRCFGLGRHLVLFTKPRKLLSRIKAALEGMDRPYRMDLVEYYDEGLFHGFFNGTDVLFRKRRRFEAQREYRVAVGHALEMPGPFTLDVGDLSDIAMLTTPERFNESLRLELPDGTWA
jgi:hypothetical protein